LFGVKDFKKGGSRIAAKIAGKFIDFVQQKNGVYGFRLAHALDNFSGKRANVSFPVPANFRFVADAA